MEDGHARVGLARGSCRYESVVQALRAFEGEIDLRDVRSLLIKPNFVSGERQLAATHVDAVRAVLNFGRARCDGTAIIAEDAAVSPAEHGHCNFDCKSLVGACGVDLVDLNADEGVPVRVYDDRRLRPVTVYLARKGVEADYRISVSPPKTHDVVIVTLSIKNLVMGHWRTRGPLATVAAF